MSEPAGNALTGAAIGLGLILAKALEALIRRKDSKEPSPHSGKNKPPSVSFKLDQLIALVRESVAHQRHIGNEIIHLRRDHQDMLRRLDDIPSISRRLDDIDKAILKQENK